MSRAADLFEQLDSKRVQVGDTSWQIHIFAIREIEGRFWIQVGFAPDTAPALPLVVKAPPTIDAATVLERMRAWLADETRVSIRTLEIE